MVQNFSYDPGNASIRSAATPQSNQREINSSGTPFSTSNSGANNGTDEKPRLAPGTELSNARYKIERLVAAGGMGAVYRAIDTRFQRPCAVKEMLDNFKSESERAQSVEWFTREATLLLDLNHPCIPRVRDFFVEQGRHYLVMDFIDGQTMAEIMEREGNISGLNGARGVPEARARSWAQQICNVLTYLHRQTPPIIFRDLKPSNIMVTMRDEIKLIDFGIARTFQSQSQATIIMTPGYAPPEQVQGMPEPRSDIYALGATLHKVLTHHDAANNRPLFTFPPVRSLRPDISPGFEQIIMKALELLPDRRWSSAAEMERALLALPPVVAVPPLVPTLTTSAPAPARLSGPSLPANTPARPLASTNTPPAPTTGPAADALQEALNHINAERYDAAYVAVQRAYALEPENALVHRIFGTIFSHRKPPQVDLAMKAYNKSLELNRSDPQTHKLIGDIFLFITNQPEVAANAYRNALSLNSNDAEAHYRLGQCYEKMNQIEPALYEYQEAVRLDPKNFIMHVSLGQLAARANQLPLAEMAFTQALILRPGEYHIRFLLSQVYERENKLEDAFRECGYVVGPLGTINPEVPKTYQRIRARLGR
jgi:serine/threonine protein kinase